MDFQKKTGKMKLRRKRSWQDLKKKLFVRPRYKFAVKNSDTTLWIARIFCLFSGQISKMPEWQPLEFDQISSNQANL